MAKQSTRIEFRSLQVRRLRSASALLPIAKFAEEATDKNPNPKGHDLANVLFKILDVKRKLGPEVQTPELLIGEGEDRQVAEARQRRNRSAIEIEAVTKISERRIRVDFEWSVPPPPRILNLQNGNEFRPQLDDSGMQRTTALIHIPDTGSHAYVGVEHRAGVVSVFEPALQRWFREQTDMENFRLNAAGHVPDDFWKQFLEQGTVLQLDFSKATVPTDLTDFVEAGEAATARSAGTVKAVVKLEPGLFSAGKRWVSNQLERFNGEVTTPGSITWENITYERVKARVRHHGIERTLELGAELNARNAPAFPVEVEQTVDQYLDSDDLAAQIGSLMDDTLGV